MNTPIKIKRLPASVPYASIPDAATRIAVMKIYEDICHLQKQIELFANAINKLVKAKG